MRWKRLPVRRDQFEYAWLIILAALIGVLAGFGNLGFDRLIALCTLVYRSLEWRALGIPRGGYYQLYIPVVLVSGGLTLALLGRMFPDVLRAGFVDFLAMLHLEGAKIRRRWIFFKALGASISLGAGASVGREGPIAQIGGSIGSAVAQSLRLSGEQAKVLVACGAGAGIAAAFNAPLGGFFFAQEIVLLGESELGHLSLLVVSTTCAAVTMRALMGDAALLKVTYFSIDSYWELVSYAGLGVFIGLLAPFFIHFFYFVAGLFRRMRMPLWLNLTVGMTLVGLIAIPLRQNLSDGYPVIDQALNGKLGIQLMALLCIGKILGASLSLGSGVPGGTFGPIFYIGAMAGGAMRGVFSFCMPDYMVAHRGSYALVGLGTFLAAATHAPLTAVFLLFEMTQTYQVMIPVLLSAIIALVIARSIEPESLDTFGLARQGKSLEIGRDRLILTQIEIGSVRLSTPTTVATGASLSEVLSLAGETHQEILPVVDQGGRLAGTIVTHELLALIPQEQDLAAVVNAFDISRKDFPSVTPRSNLDQALRLMEDEQLSELPVIEDSENRRLNGLITRQEIARAFNRTSISVSMVAARETDISWSSGYRVAHITVPERAAGKTLRGLDARARYNVSVIAMLSAADSSAGFVPAAPDHALRVGDVLVAAGRASNLRRFEHELQGHLGT